MTEHEAIVIARPAAPRRLLLMFHGVGSSAADLQPLGAALAPLLPDAWIVSVRSPEPSGSGSGWQWFSVQGIDEANRPARVAAAMPGFAAAVRHWQREAGVAAAGTLLLGFSQGAIMALESTQQPEPLAGRVVAIAGRFARPPRVAPAGAAIHLLHGDADGVMPVALAVAAHAELAALGAEVTLDRFPGLGHGIDGRVLQAIARRLGPQAAR